MRRGALWVVAMIALGASTSGCKPKYSGTGSISTEAGPFRPSACHLMGARATGIELVDDAGTRIEVTLPPSRLDYNQEIEGKASVAIGPRALGACATLKMRGEGYHDARGRAASGHVSFACGNDLRGDLDYAGCF